MPSHNNEYISRSPTRQETIRSDASQQFSNGHEPASRSELSLVASPLKETESPILSSLDGQHSSVSAGSVQTPSPTPSGFQALAEASSCSPDPEYMTVALSPSLAEMLASTINGVHHSPSKRTAGPSSRRRAESHVLPKALNPKRARLSSRTPSDQEINSPSRMQMDQNSQPSNETDLRPPSSHSRPRSRSRSHTSPSSSIQKEFARRVQVNPTLPSISETVPTSDTQGSSNPSPLIRLFRTGSIRLEPNTLPEPLDKTSHLHPDTDANTQPRPETQSEAHLPAPPPPLDPVQHTSNPYMDDMDILSTSLDPPIPAFTQAFDIQGQSQWPLATQAPYSFDSQLAFSSQ